MRKRRSSTLLRTGLIAGSALACLLGLATAAQATDSLPGAAAPEAPPKVTTISPAAAPDVPEASGTFSFTTANGIAPTWKSYGITVSGISPGSALSNNPLTNVRVAFPIVAKDGTANFAAGGFKLTNMNTGDFVNCQTPVIDTRAKVVDCVMKDLKNRHLFRIVSIRSVQQSNGNYSTSVYRGILLRVADQDTADFLNEELGANTFSPSVNFAGGQLTVTTAG